MDGKLDKNVNKTVRINNLSSDISDCTIVLILQNRINDSKCTMKTIQLN